MLDGRLQPTTLCIVNQVMRKNNATTDFRCWLSLLEKIRFTYLKREKSYSFHLKNNISVIRTHKDNKH